MGWCANRSVPGLEFIGARIPSFILKILALGFDLKILWIVELKKYRGNSPRFVMK